MLATVGLSFLALTTTGVAAHKEALTPVVASSSAKTYTYQGQKLTKAQYHDKSIREKLDFIAKHAENHESAEHRPSVFTDLLAEIKQVKEVHGKILSPDAFEATKEDQHLRSLMKKNNFIELSVYSDMWCTQKTRSVGRLVNYCYNQYGTSFLFKVNRKDNLITQIEYDQSDCRGIPSKVIDLQAITHVESQSFAECVNGVQWNYLSEYPSFDAAGAAYGATYSSYDLCTNNVADYYGFDFRKGDVCFKVPRQNTVYAKSNVQGCETSGVINVNYYFDNTCMNSVAYSMNHLKEYCAYTSPWDGDDQDDFKQDGSNYVADQVHTDYCYDPTHSPMPPPPVTGTCAGDFFDWVGDGFCDPSKNNPGCNYDGGDCCKSTCVDTLYNCGIAGYDCMDPNAP